MVLLFFNFWLLRSPWVWICNQQMGQNRSLMCRKMLMGWAWKQYNHFSPHFIDQWTHPLVPQSLLTTRALGYLFSLCAQEKEMFGEQLINLHYHSSQGTIVGWDNSWEVLTWRPARMQVCAWLLSCVWLFATPWTAACQASLSIGFSSQEYWSGLPFPSPGQPKYAYYELSISIYDHHYGIVAHLSIFFHILDVLGLLW